MDSERLLGLPKGVPVDMCSGCQVPMTLHLLQPYLSAPDLYTAVFRCDRCGTKTYRQIKSDPHAESKR
jgi:hypothetical protein